MGKSFLIIGLGRFGESLACALIEAGHEVLGVDRDPAVVQALANQLTHVVQADATQEDVLRSLGVNNFDAVIVGSAGNFESSTLITLSLKQLGARHIVAKALTDMQAEVLRRVGADEVILPEREAGLRLARRLTAPNILEYLALGPDLSVAELVAPDFLTGKTLGELDVRRRYRVTVLLIKNGDRLVISPDPDDRIEAGDVLVVVGRDADIQRLRQG
ncbi:MAG: TrkA family potassium uptake protein [Anaerolineae bacterium]|nr:TrkA family potassium uptake protein [Anaerolineae bacterium]MDW8099628.1 TrkA family potassium uptake protein [Anaerolineae bacterium]